MCGRKVPVGPDGRFRVHYAGVHAVFGVPPCPGSGKPAVRWDADT